MLYFDRFPVLLYNIDKNVDHSNNYQVATDIMVRVGILKSALDNIFYYYEYVIKDSDTPEGLAEKVYGNPESHWIILMANNMINPQFDWPRNYDEMTKYLVGKYGSVANAQTQVDHYESLFMTVDVETNTTNTTRTTISADTYTALALPTSAGAPTSYLIKGRALDVYQWKNIVNAYDQELEDNENKRNIKVIKPEYYQTLMDQFTSLLVGAGAPSVNLRVTL